MVPDKSLLSMKVEIASGYYCMLPSRSLHFLSISHIYGQMKHSQVMTDFDYPFSSLFMYI